MVHSFTLKSTPVRVAAAACVVSFALHIVLVANVGPGVACVGLDMLWSNLSKSDARAGQVNELENQEPVRSWGVPERQAGEVTPRKTQPPAWG